MQQRANALFVSPATLWEISIKDALGKLTLPEPFEQLFPSRLDADGTDKGQAKYLGQKIEYH